MHECPECGEMCDCHEADPENDCRHNCDGLSSPYVAHDSYRPETACVDCGALACDQCQCCGGALCVMHGETGAGFCRNCPTQDWIDEQAAEWEADQLVRPLPLVPMRPIKPGLDDELPF